MTDATHKAPDLPPCPYCGEEPAHWKPHYDGGGFLFETSCSTLGCLFPPMISANDHNQADAWWRFLAEYYTRLTAERDALAKKLAQAEAILAAHDAWATGEPSQPPATGRDKTTIAKLTGGKDD